MKLIWNLTLLTTVCCMVCNANQLADVPNLFMGTNNDGKHYSRGNQYPAITVPFGMTAWSPVTGEPGSGWFFDFDDKKINAIKATHQPSPWAKDYGSFEIMAMTGELKTKPEQRASAFSRERETCKAYHYRAELEDYDVVFEVAPTLRCASFNMNYPETDQAWLLFDHQEGKGSAQVDVDGRKVTGRVLNGKPLNTPFITHEQIMAGGTLSLELGPKPDKEWGASGAYPWT